MAAIVNDRDALIMGTSPRYTAPTNMDMRLYPESAIFKQSTDGLSASPNSYTFQVTLLNLYGTVTFTWSAGLTFTVSGNTATLTYANFTTGSGWLTATFVSEGVTYTRTSNITKLADGTNGVGTPGTPGTKSVPVFLFQRGASAPAAPTGTSTLTWATGANSSYTATDGWSVVAPANPGTPGLTLWVVSRIVTAASDTTSTAGISYAGLTVSPWTSNGATGPTGAGGVQSAAAEVFQWAATIPAGPVGSPTWNWGTRLFDAAPTGWTLAPGAPVIGYTLWAATVQVIDTAGATTTPFNWTSAAISPRAGGGAAGLDGLSYVTAYCASTTSATSTAPAATTGKASVPAVNGGGVTGTWTSAVPTLATNERMWNTDGIYNPATNQVTWSIPYWSVFKVGSLSAISANFGAMTAGQIDLGSAGNSWHVDPAGNMWSGASTLAAAPFSVLNTGQVVMSAATIKMADGTVLFSTGAGLTAAGAAPGTLNSAITVAGRNLAIDSAFERGLRTWTTRSAAVKNSFIEGSAGSKYLYIETDGGDAFLLGEGLNVPVTAGVTYTITFDYATATVGTINSSSSYINGASGSYPLPFSASNTGGVRARSTPLIWLCPAGTTSIQPRFGLNSTGFSWLKVFNFKVAEGNKDSQWSAAPEDLAVGISTAQTTAVASASTALWSGVSGVLRPEDSATRGATFGTNIYGQINPANITTYIAGAAIGLAQINVASIGYLTALSAELGSASISSVGFLRCGQSTYNSGTGWFLGMIGGSPRFSIGVAGGRNMRWDGTDLIIEGARMGDNVTASMTGGNYFVVNTNQQFTDFYVGTYVASMANASSNLAYSWAVNPPSAVSMRISGQGASVIVYATGRLLQGQELDFYVNCTVTDLTSSISRPASANSQIAANT